jgi:hypothetical protein
MGARRSLPGKNMGLSLVDQALTDCDSGSSEEIYRILAGVYPKLTREILPSSELGSIIQSLSLPSNGSGAELICLLLERDSIERDSTIQEMIATVQSRIAAKTPN